MRKKNAIKIFTRGGVVGHAQLHEIRPDSLCRHSLSCLIRKGKRGVRKASQDFHEVFLVHSAEENVVQISGGDKEGTCHRLSFSSVSARRCHRLSGSSHTGPQDTQDSAQLEHCPCGQKETFLQDGKLESRTAPPPLLIITPDGAVDSTPQACKGVPLNCSRCHLHTSDSCGDAHPCGCARCS